MSIPSSQLAATESLLAQKEALSALVEYQQLLRQRQQQQQQPQSPTLLARRKRKPRAKVHMIIHLASYASFALVTSYAVGMSHNLVIAACIFVLFSVVGYCNFPSQAYQWFVATKRYELYSRALRRADIREEPVVVKSTEGGENASLEYGFSCMQGWRRTMEDDHTLLLLDEGGFFGIYDGHSGAGVAKFCGTNMFRFISETDAFAQGKVRQAFYDGFIAVDKHLHAVEEGTRERSGCTAVVLYVKDDVLYCANAGDSRCVLCRNGKAEPMSVDHKPFLPSEQTRIERAGCYVVNRRVNGILALSRAIGDFTFKSNPDVPWDQQAVTSSPEVRTLRLNRDKDEFAVVACDGIWDVMTNEEVVDFVRPRIQERVALTKIAEDLLDKCLSAQPFGLGCDNMSVVIVKFKRRAQRQSITEGMAGNSPGEAVLTPCQAGGSNGARKTAVTMSAADPTVAAALREGEVELLLPGEFDDCVEADEVAAGAARSGRSADKCATDVAQSVASGVTSSSVAADSAQASATTRLAEPLLSGSNGNTGHAATTASNKAAPRSVSGTRQNGGARSELDELRYVVSTGLSKC